MIRIFLSLLFFKIIIFANIANDHITWRVIDWPPMYIQNGIYKNQGIYNNIITQLSIDLPEYTHSTLTMNTSRVINQMKNNKKVCHPSVLENTDAKLSIVNSIILPLQIIANKKVITQMGNKDSYSLKKLLENKSLIGGFVIGRYTKKINEIIQNTKYKSNFILSQNYNSLIKMILNNRIDYIIEYSAAVNFIAKELNIDNMTKNININDANNKEFLKVYTACPNNKWGNELIKKINKSLIKESKNNYFIKERIRWFNKEDQIKLKQIYKENYFLDKR